jgi:hypothetical protein
VAAAATGTGEASMIGGGWAPTVGAGAGNVDALMARLASSLVRSSCSPHCRQWDRYLGGAVATGTKSSEIRRTSLTICWPATCPLRHVERTVARMTDLRRDPKMAGKLTAPR